MFALVSSGWFFKIISIPGRRLPLKDNTGEKTRGAGRERTNYVGQVIPGVSASKAWNFKVACRVKFNQPFLPLIRLYVTLSFLQLRTGIWSSAAPYARVIGDTISALQRLPLVGKTKDEVRDWEVQEAGRNYRVTYTSTRLPNQKHINESIMTHRNVWWSPLPERRSLLSHFRDFSGPKRGVLDFKILTMSAMT